MWTSRKGAVLNIDRPVIIVRPGPPRPSRPQHAVLAVYLQGIRGRELSRTIGCHQDVVIHLVKCLEAKWGVKGVYAATAFAVEQNLVSLWHLEKG